MKPTIPPQKQPAIVVASATELAALIRDAVDEALAAQRADPAPLLLDRDGIAKALGVGLSSIDRFRKARMPCVWNGDSPRFVASECLAWMQKHKRSAEPDTEHAEERAGHANGSSSLAP